MPDPTLEEIERVRAWMCGKAGHVYEVIESDATREPLAVACRQCERRWRLLGAVPDAT